MKILITGATGGLGIALVRKMIDEDHEIIATGRDGNCGKSLAQLGADFVYADLTKTTNYAPLLEGVELIIHAAALSSPWGRYEEFHAINFEATKKLFDAAKKAGLKAFIFISSPSVFSAPFDRLAICENDTIYQKHLNYYARTKLMAENYLMQNADGVSTIILRPRAIIGFDDKVLLPRFLRLIKRGKFPFINNGMAQIELTDVRDVANAVNLCAQNYGRLNGEVFNISGGKSMRLVEMVSSLCDAISMKVRHSSSSYERTAPIIKTLEFLCSVLPNRPEPILTHYSLCALAFSQTFDLAKARNILGYNPQFDPFKSAIEIAKAQAVENDN